MICRCLNVRRCVCLRASPCLSVRHLADPPRSNNSLTALPDSLLSALPTNSISLIDLSRNKFSAAGVDNFRSALAGMSTEAQLDLSFNGLGPLRAGFSGAVVGTRVQSADHRLRHHRRAHQRFCRF